MAEKELLLHAEQIDKAFGPTHAVDHVSLDFYKGEVHCLIGENGSGKSTFTNMLTGILPIGSRRSLPKTRSTPTITALPSLSRSRVRWTGSRSPRTCSSVMRANL